jgi:hypothetical protein
MHKFSKSLNHSDIQELLTPQKQVYIKKTVKVPKTEINKRKPNPLLFRKTLENVRPTKNFMINKIQL